MHQTVRDENYAWNFTVNLLDGVTFWFGFSLISTTTIMPLFISKLTTSLLPIGLISVIHSAGWFLPQLFSARITERYEKKKRIVVGWGFFLERIPIWFMILSTIVARTSPLIALGMMLFALTWNAMGAGIVATAWMSLIAKIFPPTKRGSFLGLTMFIGSVFGILGSALSVWLLETYIFPDSFIILYSIAAVFTTLSWVFLALTREPQGVVVDNGQSWQAYWKDLIKIIKNDHNYRRFVVSSLIITLGSMGSGFVTISAIQRFNVSDSTVGLYSLSLLVGQTVGYLILGKLADRYGHKQSLEIGVLAILLAFLITFFMRTPALYFVVFALLGINLSSWIVSGMLVVWEFCDTARVPTYSGLANTVRGVVGTIAPLIATQFASFGFGLLFGICTLVTLIGLTLLKVWVTEPRLRSLSQEESS